MRVSRVLDSVVAYLSQPAAGDGAHVLLAMKAAIDGAAAIRGLSPTAYYVDSGRCDDASAFGHALLRLVRDARRGQISTVVVLGRGALAEDARMVVRALQALENAGVVVLELGERCDGGLRRTPRLVGDAA